MKNVPITKESLCPCCSGERFKQCCSPFLNNEKLASTPEQLMRSRYTAFYIGSTDYLLRTLHPSKRQTDDLAVLQNTINSTKWLSLVILNTDGLPNKEGEGVVEFVALHS